MHDTKEIGIRFNEMMVFSKGFNQGFLQIFHRRYAAGRYFKINTGLLDLFFGVIDDLRGIHFGVGQKYDVVIFIEQGYFRDVDINDLSALFADLDEVIDGNFTAEGNDNPANDVRDKIFR